MSYRIRPKNVNFKLRGARAEKGISQKDLADKVGISRTKMNFIEMGYTLPTTEDAKKIANVLGKTIEYLFS